MAHLVCRFLGSDAHGLLGRHAHHLLGGLHTHAHKPTGRLIKLSGQKSPGALGHWSCWQHLRGHPPLQPTCRAWVAFSWAAAVTPRPASAALPVMSAKGAPAAKAAQEKQCRPQRLTVAEGAGREVEGSWSGCRNQSLPAGAPVERASDLTAETGTHTISSSAQHQEHGGSGWGRGQWLGREGKWTHVPSWSPCVARHPRLPWSGSRAATEGEHWSGGMRSGLPQPGSSPLAP